MEDNQNWSRTGEQFKGALSEALQNGDFKHLNELVSQTVTEAVAEVGKHVSISGINSRSGGNPNANDYGARGRQGGSSQTDSRQQENTSRLYQGQNAQSGSWQQAPRQNSPGQNAQAGSWQQAPGQNTQSGSWQQTPRQNGQTQNTQSGSWQQGQTQQANAWQQSRQNQTAMPVWQQRAQERELKKQQAQTHRSLPSIRIKKVGNVSNVLYQVFGGIGLGISGLIAFFRFFALLYGETSFAGWIVNFVFLFGFYSMVRLGVGQKKRLKRAERYLQLCDYRVYGEIENLARGTGKSRKYVIKDLQKMLALGIFPEGHLDEQKTCFMLNDEVYRQYLEAENNRRIRELESKKALEDQQASKPEQKAPEAEVSPEQKSELQAMMDEGMEYIRKLRNLNDRIPGEVISAKLFCLENLLKDIFESVKQHPDQMDRMYKLMSYYLPTTLKLVESYETFDRVSSPGPDIVKAKAEIENTLDTINQAFRELLNNLFQDKVFDVTTDAQVLKSMLAREGLTKDMDFAGFEQK